MSKVSAMQGVMATFLLAPFHQTYVTVRGTTRWMDTLLTNNNQMKCHMWLFIHMKVMWIQ